MGMMLEYPPLVGGRESLRLYTPSVPSKGNTWLFIKWEHGCGIVLSGQSKRSGFQW